MKRQKEYKLEEAIKNFYTTKPLKADLATTVADKVFEKHKKVYPAFETWLYIFIGVLVAAGIIYSFSFFNHFSVPSGLMILISIAFYFSLFFKEYLLIHKRLLS